MCSISYIPGLRSPSSPRRSLSLDQNPRSPDRSLRGLGRKLLWKGEEW